jgi:hypothetical protein
MSVESFTWAYEFRAEHLKQGIVVDCADNVYKMCIFVILHGCAFALDFGWLAIAMVN